MWTCILNPYSFDTCGLYSTHDPYLLKPVPLYVYGYGFWQVWAWVALKNPRVAHEIPYLG